MDIEKLINDIVNDLQKDAMPFENYVYEVKVTHQTIRKHLEALDIDDVSNQRELLIAFGKKAVKDSFKSDKPRTVEDSYEEFESNL